MNNIKRISSEEDIKTAADLAAEIYRDHYIPIVGKEQVEYMLNKFQNSKAIKEQIDEGTQYFLIYNNEKPCGYFAVELNNPEGKMFLSKLYIQKKERGNGLSKDAFKIMKDIAKENKISSIWLHVNKYNPTIKIYEGLGFTKKESVKDSIGGGFYMDDFLMEAEINNIKTS